MTTIAGLPAHALLVHAIVVLAPLTAALAILCALWPTARRRLVWLVLVLAVITTALTPLTTEAGEWLLAHSGEPSEVLLTHIERGEWMIYFAVALLVVAVLLAVLQWLEGRSDQRRVVLQVVIALVAVLVGVSSVVAVIQIGHAGTEAVWGGRV
jgi:ABC-type branched-subunit amino acid transport system permease subunit